MGAALRNILIGTGTLFNITGQPLGRPTFLRSDQEAMRSDWEAVGKDLWAAVHEYRRSIPESEQLALTFAGRRTADAHEVCATDPTGTTFGESRLREKQKPGWLDNWPGGLECCTRH